MSEEITSFTALTAAAGGDLLVAVDVSDTTDAATGTTKKITYDSLFTIPDGSVIKSGKTASLSTIDISSIVDTIIVTTDGGAEGESGYYIDSGAQGNWNFVDGYNSYTKLHEYDTSKYMFEVVMSSSGFTIASNTDVVTSSGGINSFISTSTSSFATSVSEIGAATFHSDTVSVIQNVQRSVALGGSNYDVKTNDTAYSNQFALATSLSTFETIIKSVTQTADRLVTIGDRNLDFTTAETYTPTNVVTDRAYDANATTTAELADVLGTLIADLKTIGIIV